MNCSVGRKIQVIYPILYYSNAFRLLLSSVILFSLYISLLFLSFIKIVRHLWGIKNLRLFLQCKGSVQSGLQWERKGVEVSQMLALMLRSGGFFTGVTVQPSEALCLSSSSLPVFKFFYSPYWIHPFVQQVPSCSVGQQTVQSPTNVVKNS